MSRALIYIRQQLQNHIRRIEEKNTKGLGEAAFRLGQFGREVRQICSMSGDTILAQEILGAIDLLTERTPRAEALVLLNNLLRRLEGYQPEDDLDDVDSLRERISILESQLQGDNGQDVVDTDTSDASSVFVIMPFRADLNDVWIGGIQRAAQDEGFTPIRVDMINRSTNITDDIISSIEKCHLAIVDVTDNNPNVMFELGYALAKQKPNIIISQSADYLPFDIRNIRTIIYTNSWSGIEDLRKKIQGFLREFKPKKAASSTPAKKRSGK